MEEVRRIFSEVLDKHLSENTHILRATNQPVAGLKHEARQPRLAAEADVETDKKARKRTEGAAAADRAKHTGDSSSAKRVDDGPTSLTSFGKVVEPSPARPCRNDALVDKGAKAPKPCLSPAEMRTPPATGGRLPSGTASTAMRTILPLPFLWNFCPTEDMKFRPTISIQLYATYISFQKMKILETKSRQTLVFDPGGCTGRLRTCPFLGEWHALLCGEVFVWTLRWCPTGGERLNR